MSAPAPVTKAHIELAETALFSRDKAGRLLTAPMAAQLIADSEAKATVELKKRADHWCDMHTVCAKERDQLRAEVERLKKQIKDDNLSYGCELRDPYGTIWEQATKDHDRAGKAERALAELREWQAGVIANERLHHAERKDAIARAESAESQLHALRLICGTTDADKFSTWVDRANTRAEKAESELAGIRALANRRNKRDHSEDTTHQLVAALDQALDIAQAELAATKSTLDEEVNCAEKAEHEVVRQYARAERAEAFLRTLGKWEEAQ